jgi:hypothetical protein
MSALSLLYSIHNKEGKSGETSERCRSKTVRPSHPGTNREINRDMEGKIMKKNKWIAPILLVLFYGVFIFQTSPNLSPFYAEGMSFWAFLISAASLVFWMLRTGDLRFINQNNGTFSFSLPRRGRVFLWMRPLRGRSSSL